MGQGSYAGKDSNCNEYNRGESEKSPMRSLIDQDQASEISVMTFKYKSGLEARSQVQAPTPVLRASSVKTRAGLQHIQCINDWWTSVWDPINATDRYIVLLKD